MEIKTGKEIVAWTRGKSISEMNTKPYHKKWVSVDELREELFKICDDVKSLISTHNIKVEDKYLHTLYLGTVNKMLNQFNRNRK